MIPPRCSVAWKLGRSERIHWDCDIGYVTPEEQASTPGDSFGEVMPREVVGEEVGAMVSCEAF